MFQGLAVLRQRLMLRNYIIGLSVWALGRDGLKRKQIMCLTPLCEGGRILVLPYATFGKLWLETSLLL